MTISLSLKTVNPFFLSWPVMLMPAVLILFLFPVWSGFFPSDSVAPCFAATILVTAPGPGGTSGANVNGTAVDDTITIESGATAGTVKGNAGDDTIVLDPGAAAAIVNGNGGNDTITNAGTVTTTLRGGADNDTIINSGTVTGRIEGQTGTDIIVIQATGQVTGSTIGGTANSSGNTITNLGTAKNIYGTANTSNGSSAGSNTISNSGSAEGLYGSTNEGANSSGNSNTITNSGTLSGIAPGITGSWNFGTTAAGGSNSITNTGIIGHDIMGSYNSGSGSSGGNNTVINAGTTAHNIYGSYNGGFNSSGGSNIIINTGTVDTIYGSYNSGFTSSGGANTITNTGTVTGSIYGTRNFAAGATATGNTITNAGTVGGSIYGGTGDDTVVIQNGSSVGGSVDGQAGTDLLKFESAGTVDGNQYLNFESLSITGATTLTNTLTIAGVSANTGTFIINSTLGTTSLANSGTLGGSGTISGDVDNTGTLTPGNSIGTLVITGNYTHGATSTYACELAEDGTSDLIQVTGTATLNGGTVSLSSNTALAGGTSWTILTAGGGVTGTFATLSSAVSSLVFNFGLTYNANDVQVTVSRTPYASFGATENQIQVGAALDSLIPLASTRTDTMAALIAAMDFTYSLARIQSTLEAMSPEMYDGFTWSAIEGTRRFTAIMGQQMAERRISRDLKLHGNPSPNGHNQWLRLLGGWGTCHGASGHLGYSGNFNGLAVGADQPMLPWLTMGLAMGLQSVDMDWDGAIHDGDQQILNTGVYARSDFGSLHLDGSASFAMIDSRADRDISSTGYKTAGSFNSEALSGRLNGGYDFRLGNWIAGPQVSVDYLTLSENALLETGADSLNLAVEKRRTTYGSAFLGFGGAARFGTGQRILVPRIRLGWRHCLTPGARSITASFQDYPGSPFTVTGMEPAKNVLRLDAGLTLTLGKGCQTFFQCSIDQGDGDSLAMFSTGVTLAF